MANDPAREAEDSPYQIQICGAPACAREDPHASIDAERIAHALRYVLRAHGRPAANLSVALVDDAAMTKLHHKYMNIAETTDVLTFDLSDGDSDAVDAEIVICTDVAARESKRRNHPFADEILLYTVHGCLHLLGYDDLGDDASARMHAREDELLIDLGVGPVYRRAAW